MKADTRRNIAFVVGRLKCNEKANCIYDCGANNYFYFDGEVNENCVKVYDSQQSLCFLGTGKATSYNLVCGQSQNKVDLIVSEKVFRGYDFTTKEFFEGIVDQNKVLFQFNDTNNREYSYQVE